MKDGITEQITHIDQCNTTLPGKCLHCTQLLGTHQCHDDHGHSFCCTGCRAVYKLLQQHNLLHFYTLTEKLGGSAPTLLTAEDNPSLSSSAYKDLGERFAVALDGIQCASCVWLLEQLPQLHPGVLTARMNLTEGTLTCSFDKSRTTVEAIITAVESLGYRAKQSQTTSRPVTSSHDLIRIGVAGACAMNIMMLAVSLYQGLFTGIEYPYEQLFRWISFALSLPIILYCALPFYRRGYAALRTGVLHIDTPITLGLILSFLLSGWNTIMGSGEIYFDSLATIVFLLLATRYAQQRAFERIRRDLSSSWSLLPAQVTALINGTPQQISLRSIEPMMEVLVSPGERIPCDGVVQTGCALIDTSAISGESRPITVSPQQPVLAGSLVIDSPLHITAATQGGASRLDRILQQVALESERPVSVITSQDKLSMIFTAAAVIFALGGFIFNLDRGISSATSAAIAMLTVTCPCAVALALPLLSLTTLRLSSRAGILVRSPQVFEDIPRCPQYFFDKTGTLTTGKLSVEQVEILSSHAESLPIIQQLITIEPHHPVSKALTKWLTTVPSLSSANVKLDRAQKIPGRGVLGSISSPPHTGTYTLQSGHGYLQQYPHQANLLADTLMQHQNATIVVYHSGQEALMAFALQDTLSPDAVSTIRQLHTDGISSGILSGDRSAVVASYAQQLGISKELAHGDLMPEDKAQLLPSNGAVYIGDGANDAPALSRATVGIALRGGVQSILECAQVYILRGGLAQVVKLRQLASAYLSRARLIVALGLLYNFVGISAALAGYVTPLVAAVAMPLFSSVLLLLSSVLFTPNLSTTRD